MTSTKSETDTTAKEPIPKRIGENHSTTALRVATNDRSRSAPRRHIAARFPTSSIEAIRVLAIAIGTRIHAPRSIAVGVQTTVARSDITEIRRRNHVDRRRRASILLLERLFAAGIPGRSSSVANSGIARRIERWAKYTACREEHPRDQYRSTQRTIHDTALTLMHGARRKAYPGSSPHRRHVAMNFIAAAGTARHMIERVSLPASRTPANGDTGSDEACRAPWQHEPCSSLLARARREYAAARQLCALPAERCLRQP